MDEIASLEHTPTPPDLVQEKVEAVAYLVKKAGVEGRALDMIEGLKESVRRKMERVRYLEDGAKDVLLRYFDETVIEL